jgi:ATP-dependent protease ClpP protease subunit
MSDLKVDQVLQIYEIETDVALKYGIDLNSRVIQLVGEINDMAFCHIDTALTLMEAKGRSAVTIRIHSPGGSVYSALAIISRIRSSKCQIITEAYGSCMSAATLILAAGKKRRMGAAAIVMHHEAAYEIGGTHTQVQQEYTNKALKLGVLVYEIDAMEDQIKVHKERVFELKMEMSKLSQQAAEKQKEQQANQEVKND